MTDKPEEKKTEEQQKPQEPKDPNSVFVANKPPMTYVSAVVTRFNEREAEKVILKARGRGINVAVDVSQIVSNRFLPDKVEIGNIKVNSEDLEGKDGRNKRVSTMEIELLRKKQ